MALPHELDLVIGAQYSAPITGAGSQGYHWIVTVTGDADAVEVTTAGVPPAEASGVGSYGRELQIDARALGVATLSLALVRSGGEVREQHTIAVRVH